MEKKNGKSYGELVKVHKTIEYWVEEVDENGDIIDYLYQDNNKKEALRIAETYEFAPGIVKVEVERVTRWGSDAEGVIRQEYEDLYSRAKEV